MKRPHGKAVVDSTNPEPFGICDRCGGMYNLSDLRYQHQWAGTAMVNTRLRVCHLCLDQPSPFLRSLIIPPDPEPVLEPRPEPYVIDETDTVDTETGQTRVTETDSEREME